MEETAMAQGILTGKFRLDPNFEKGDHRAKNILFMDIPRWTRPPLPPISKVNECDEDDILVDLGILQVSPSIGATQNIVLPEHLHILMNPLVMIGAGLMFVVESIADKAGSMALINTSPEPLTNWIASISEDVIVVAGFLPTLNHPSLFINFSILFVTINR